jgi:hypothetical protein
VKLIELLKEIQVIPPGKGILWGWNANGYFTELAKLRGFKTSQEALDEINKILGLDVEGEYPYWTNSHIDNPSYVYLSDDGQVEFTKDLSSFGTGSGYDTEEGWGVAEWSTKPPL